MRAERFGSYEGLRPVGIAKPMISEGKVLPLTKNDTLVGEQNGPAMHILVVDGDDAIRNMVVNYLREHNMRAIPASGREDVVSQFSINEPKLVILDLYLGKDDGLDVLREIRAWSNVPIILTSKHRRDEADRIIGLELGADDYVTKPIELRELLARVRALLRRRGCQATPRDPEHGRYRFGGWQLDRRNRRLTNSSGAPVGLTKGLYALLITFLDAPHRPLTREYLLNATRVHEDVFDRSIDIQILRLRRKLEVESGAPRIIQTQRGVGYVFMLPVERLAPSLSSAHIAKGFAGPIPSRARVLAS
jgi:two-component system OmpR family response regulator